MNHPPTTRAAAIADYLETGDTIAEVAARHGVARSTLGTWTAGIRHDLGYNGGWEVRGLIQYPRRPAKRSA